MDSDNYESSIISNIPNFDLASFNKKTEQSFYEIQTAWQNKDLSKVRRYMSDGVYQRFSVQFLMMDSLKQRNILKDIKLHANRIVAAEQDGNYHIVHVRMDASMDDEFVCELDSSLDNGGFEEFTEYWTFVKKESTKQVDMYSSNNCPNCGSDLPHDLGEVSKCPACGSITNTGEFDWVLTEITQPTDFVENYNSIKSRSKYFKAISEKGITSHEFSPQYIEDKASNAILQYKIAAAFKDRKRISRFCSDSFNAKIQFPAGENYLYNRLYTTDVSLSNMFENGAIITAALKVSIVEQQVLLTDKKLKLKDRAPIELTTYVLMSRNKVVKEAKNSALAHNCSNCGAPVEDTLQLTCQYCDAKLNDNSRDWILEDVLTQADYENVKDGLGMPVISQRIEKSVLKEDLDIRDFALNNIMAVVMADGVITDEERVFLVDTAKGMGYNSNKVSELWEQSRSNALALKMPSDEKQKQKVLKHMYRAAKADGAISKEEQEIIDYCEKL